MKIVKPSPVTWATRQAECGYCHAVLEVEMADLHLVEEGTYLGATCATPGCGGVVKFESRNGTHPLIWQAVEKAEEARRLAEKQRADAEWERSHQR